MLLEINCYIERVARLKREVGRVKWGGGGSKGEKNIKNIRGRV